MTAPVRLRFGKPGAPGEFVIDLAKAEVFRGETPLRLQQQPFRLLAALVERPGDVLTRAELSERLWGAGTFVDAEAGINTAIAKLRDALGDTAEMPEIVQTVPRRGYRFVATVSAAEENVPAQEPRSRLFRIAVRVLAAGAAVLPVLAAVAIWHAPRAKVPIAVILFDNETDRPEWDRLAKASPTRRCCGSPPSRSSK